MGGITVHSYGWMAQQFGRAVMTSRQLQYVASREIPVDDLTIYAYPHPFMPGDGASPTTAIQAWLTLASQAESAQSDQYDRGPDRKVIVTPPEDVTTTEELRAYQKRLDKMVKESDTGVVATAHGGIHDLTVSPDDMGYSEASNVFGSAILGAHGTPKSAVGMNEGMTYGSVSASIRAFGTLSVQSDLDTLADEDTMQMRAEEGPAFSLEYPCPPFDDPELKETQLQNDMAAGAITVGEWRIERGMDRFGDKRDDLPAGGSAIKEWSPQGASQAGGVPGQPGAPGAAQGITPPASELGKRLATIMGGRPGEAGGSAPGKPLTPPMGALGSKLSTIMGGQAKSLIRVSADRSNRRFVVAVDLDGTLSADGEYDERKIGAPRTGMVEAVRALKEAGCGVVIYTCRDSDSLVATWCDEHGVPFDAINANPWSDGGSGKMMADLYLDNRAVNAAGPDASVMAAVMDAINDREVREAIRGAVYKRRFDRMYGFLFIPIDGSADRIAKEARLLVDSKHLAGDGIEPEPHITLLHAVAEKPWAVTEPLRAIGKFGFEVGRLGVFKHDDGTAHVVVRVSGVALQDARRLCEQSLTHMASQYAFDPHITIAVVAAEFADQYAGRELSMTGAVVNVGKLVYRPPGEGDLIIPLR
jgi:2'-5' RNA ligase